MNFKIKLNSSKLLLSAAAILSIVIIVQAFYIHKLKDQKTSKFFLQMNMNKQHITYQTLQNLKALMSDEDVSKEIKQEAAKKYDEFTTNAMYELKVENLLQSKGFDNVICFIEDSSAKVIISSEKGASKKNIKIIEDVIYSVSRIKNVVVQVKD